MKSCLFNEDEHDLVFFLMIYLKHKGVTNMSVFLKLFASAFDRVFFRQSKKMTIKQKNI